ncbi:MAG: SPOR domain-containing protein [Burkholderiales bacterium]
MARISVSDEEIALKKRARRRLVGAIVLVTLVVVLLPMFLDSEPRPLNQDINVQIPAQSSEFSSRVAALPKATAPEATTAGDAKDSAANTPEAASEKKPPETEPAHVEAEKPRASEPEPRAEPDKHPPERAVPAPKPAKTEPKTQPKSEAKPQPKPAPKTAEAARDTGSDGFIVQVAALTDPEKAKALKGRISESGMRAYTEIIKTARGDITRVRVGPYASKEAAQKAADELRKLGLSGVVAPRG